MVNREVLLTGDFKFMYNGVTYIGKAVNGLIERCTYGGEGRTIVGVTDNPKFLSYAKIEYYTKFDLKEIKFNTVNEAIMTLPALRFPLVGSNE